MTNKIPSWYHVTMENEMTTEQVAIAMIQHPGKKWTNGTHVVSFEPDRTPSILVHIPVRGTWSLEGFLSNFSHRIWNEHRELSPGVEFELEYIFSDDGFALGRDNPIFANVMRDALGGYDAVAKKRVHVKVIAQVEEAQA